MGRTFKHLTYEQRVKIKEMLDAGKNGMAISAELGLPSTTVYREIRRGSVDGRYNSEYAENCYRERLLHKGPKAILSQDSALAQFVAELILEEGLGLQEVVERLQRDGRFGIAPQTRQTLYAAIDSGLIPGVTRESLRADTTTVFSDSVHIAKWARKKLNIKDGDILRVEVDGEKIILSKESKA